MTVIYVLSAFGTMVRNIMVRNQDFNHVGIVIASEEDIEQILF